MHNVPRLVVLSALMLAAFAGPLNAADEAWEVLLRQQLEEKEKCVMSGTLYVRKTPAKEGTIYSGRAKCFDGRLFDFSQDKPHMKFEIRACEPTVC